MAQTGGARSFPASEHHLEMKARLTALQVPTDSPAGPDRQTDRQPPRVPGVAPRGWAGAGAGSPSRAGGQSWGVGLETP